MTCNNLDKALSPGSSLCLHPQFSIFILLASPARSSEDAWTVIKDIPGLTLALRPWSFTPTFHSHYGIFSATSSHLSHTCPTLQGILALGLKCACLWASAKNARHLLTPFTGSVREHEHICVKEDERVFSVSYVPDSFCQHVHVSRWMDKQNNREKRRLRVFMACVYPFVSFHCGSFQVLGFKIHWLYYVQRTERKSAHKIHFAYCNTRCSIFVCFLPSFSLLTANNVNHVISESCLKLNNMLLRKGG